MNIEQALKVMYEGGEVESLVSNTSYKLEKLDDRYKLYAEGLPVDITYLTKEEIQGEFREIYIIETPEQFEALDDIEKERLIDETFKGIENKINFDNKFRNYKK